MAKKKTRRKSSKEYWAERALQTEEAVHNAAEEYNKSLAEMYEKAQRKLTDEIQYRLERMAAANGISMEEARKELSKGELAGLRDSLEEYEAKVKELLTLHPDDPRVKQLEREIETASARAHITRLEEMQYNIRLTAGTLHGEALAGMEEVNRNAYTKGLYETSKDVVGDGVKPDENEVKRVLAKPWKGENFSERVWNDRDRLVEKLHEHLSVALLTGEAPDKTAQKLADDMGVSLAAAQRIVRTESAAFAQMGTMDAYKQMGVEAYEILGTVDKRTCDTCGDLDGVRVDMKDGIQGRTLPPFHPNCRCTTVPAIEEELPDLDDIEIEGDTPFDEWLKEYGGDLGVDTEGKTGDEIVEEIRQDNERARVGENSVKPAGFAKKETERISGRVLSEEEKKALDNFIEPAFKSVEEAEDMLSKNGIEFKPDGMDKDAYIISATWYLKYLNTLPPALREDIRKYSGKIKVVFLEEGIGGEADHGVSVRSNGDKQTITMGDVNPEIRLNIIHVHSREIINAQLESDRADFGVIPNVTEATLLSHEVGHALIYALAEKEFGVITVDFDDIWEYVDGKKQAKSYNVSKVQFAQVCQDIVQSAARVYNRINPDSPIQWDNKDDIARVLSEYGGENCVETVAECFSEATGGPEPRLFAKLVMKQIERRKRRLYNDVSN